MLKHGFDAKREKERKFLAKLKLYFKLNFRFYFLKFIIIFFFRAYCLNVFIVQEREKSYWLRFTGLLVRIAM